MPPYHIELKAAVEKDLRRRRVIAMSRPHPSLALRAGPPQAEPLPEGEARELLAPYAPIEIPVRVGEELASDEMVVRVHYVRHRSSAYRAL